METSEHQPREHGQGAYFNFLKRDGIEGEIHPSARQYRKLTYWKQRML